MTSRPLSIAILSLLSAAAMATNTPQGPNHDATAISGSASKSNADARSESTAVGIAGAISGSISEGGSAEQSLTNTNTATGGSGGAGGNGGQGGTGGAANQSQSADNAGNAQSIAFNDVRQTPWVVLPSIFVADCGSGVNAGGSKVGGAGAFGVTWTTAKCYDFKNGTNFVAIGAIEEACVLWVDVNRAAFKRQKHTPDCKAIALRVYEGQKLSTQSAAVTELRATPLVSAPDMSLYVKRDELPALLKDRDDRILRQAVSK